MQFFLSCVGGVAVLRRFHSLMNLCMSGVKFGLYYFLLPFGMCLLSVLLIMSLNWDVVLLSVCGELLWV